MIAIGITIAVVVVGVMVPIIVIAVVVVSARVSWNARTVVAITSLFNV